MPPKSNTLPLWGNQVSMNLNPLILTNIQSSPYFKNDLSKLKTYHEVIDEIYLKVAHLEPWERGSRQTSGQIGMCGGVRGVGAGGIVSSAYCLLYKLYTLKLTRKQLNGLLTHYDSPYIRALGFLYIRYSQPPQDLWDWYEEYLNDEEELVTKAGGGNNSVTIGQMLMHFLVKPEWHSTLFPRIPVPVMKELERKVSKWQHAQRQNNPEGEALDENAQTGNDEWNAHDSFDSPSTSHHLEYELPQDAVSRTTSTQIKSEVLTPSQPSGSTWTSQPLSRTTSTPIKSEVLTPSQPSGSTWTSQPLPRTTSIPIMSAVPASQPSGSSSNSRPPSSNTEIKNTLHHTTPSEKRALPSLSQGNKKCRLAEEEHAIRLEFLRKEHELRMEILRLEKQTAEAKLSEALASKSQQNE